MKLRLMVECVEAGADHPELTYKPMIITFTDFFDLIEKIDKRMERFKKYGDYYWGFHLNQTKEAIRYFMSQAFTITKTEKIEVGLLTSIRLRIKYDYSDSFLSTQIIDKFIDWGDNAIETGSLAPLPYQLEEYQVYVGDRLCYYAWNNVENKQQSDTIK